jgi:hypothetical protein
MQATAGRKLEDPPGRWALFQREWCAVVDEVPVDLDVVRYWDLAATEKTEFNAGAIPLALLSV